MGVCYEWFDNEKKNGLLHLKTFIQIENRLKAVYWKTGRKKRVLAFNLNIPIVKNNIDICLFNADTNTYDKGDIVNCSDKILMLGELKGGIDLAGADEHWKTGNTALNRIRTAFKKDGREISTSFVAAAIEKKMASEIFGQLQKGILSFAANLTIDEQLVNYCNWIIKF